VKSACVGVLSIMRVVFIFTYSDDLVKLMVTNCSNTQ